MDTPSHQIMIVSETNGDGSLYHFLHYKCCSLAIGLALFFIWFLGQF